MKQSVFNIKANTMDEVIQEAEKYFETISDNIDIKIISGGKKLFGLSVSPYVVQAKLKVNSNTVQESVDGSFHFEYREIGVFLVIVFSKGNGKKINSGDIIEKALEKKIREIDTQKIAEAIYKKLEESVVAPYQEEEKIDEKVIITISNDRMEAFIEFIPPVGDGNTVSHEDILALIDSNGVVYGVDNNIISELLQQKQYNTRIKFASGLLPANGIDGKIEYKVDLYLSQYPKYLEDGTVDYYERDNFSSVKTGDIIAVYKKPTLGTNGIDIMGAEIATQNGKNLTLPLGQNVSLAEDGCSIISNLDGVIEIKKDKICVSSLLTINGDVDLSVGNIKCTGNIRVNGNVISGISIVAEGSVEILGTVEDATIISKGDIKIKRGILGAGKGVLNAEGSVFAKFIENSTVFAKNKVVASSIIHSDVECFNSIVVKGEKGIILGGKLKATNKITAKNIGSNANSATILEVGIEPSLRNDYNALKAEIKKLSYKLEYISKAIDLSGNNLSQRQEAIKAKLLEDKIEKKYMLQTYIDQMEGLEQILESEYDSCVSISDTVYQGTTITIKTLTCIINAPMNFVTFRIRNGEVVNLPYTDT